MEATPRDADETSWAETMSATENGKAEVAAEWVPIAELKAWQETVSYTHLTLPTNREV